MDLAADYPEITAKPPAYAEDTVDAEITDGLVDVTLLQNGTIQLRLQVHPARRGRLPRLDHAPPPFPPPRVGEGGVGDGTKTAAQTTPHEIPLAGDRQSGSLTLPAVATGKYSLRLVAEHGIETPFPAHDVTVKPDAAPEFKQVPQKDKEDLKAVLPYDKVPLEFGVADDVAVAKADVEYRVNRRDAILEPITMTGLKTPTAEAKTSFALAGKVRRATWLNTASA